MTKYQVRQVFKDSHQRFTKSREDMCDIFIENPTTHFTVEDLISALSCNSDVNVATVYNNISCFIETGLVTEYVFNNKKHYELSQPLHAHFVCLHCGKIFNVEIPGLDCITMTLFRKYKARVFNKTIDFEGCCEDCKESDFCVDCDVKNCSEKGKSFDNDK